MSPGEFVAVAEESGDIRALTYWVLARALADSAKLSALGIARLENPERALAHLRLLADAGVKIAIDDYSVGLSSLAYLKRLPATELKIDMRFITDLVESHCDPMIVRSNIDLAHGLGLRVTAKRVDKPQSLALLKIKGCDLIQGCQVAAAMPLAGLTESMLQSTITVEQVSDCAMQLATMIGSSKPRASVSRSGSMAVCPTSFRLG